MPVYEVLDNLLEFLGLLCLIAFAYFVWPPAALLVAGLILVVTSNLRTARRKPADTDRPRLRQRMARALADHLAARAAAAAQTGRGGS